MVVVLLLPSCSTRVSLMERITLDAVLPPLQPRAPLRLENRREPGLLLTAPGCVASTLVRWAAWMAATCFCGR